MEPIAPWFKVWQYWETRGKKPAYIDGLHKITRENAGVDVTLVTPSTLRHYLPDIDSRILNVQELAHKADLIRARLVARYGGIWLDSDVVVLRDLSWAIEALGSYEFLGFTDKGQLQPPDPKVRINCFAAPPNSQVMNAWVAAQSAKLEEGRTKFAWTEIGTDLLDPICLARRSLVNIQPFELISPVSSRHVRRFGSRWRSPGKLIDQVHLVMLSNQALQKKYPDLIKMDVEAIIDEGIYLSHFLKRAKDPQYTPPKSAVNMLRSVCWRGSPKKSGNKWREE